MPIFDTHCHYNLEPLLDSWPQHWDKAQTAGVSDTVIVGVNVESSIQAITLAATHPHIYAAVGIHPSEWQEHPNLSLAKEMRVISDLAPHEKVVAVGETGIDYYRLSKDNEQVMHQQQDSLRAHLTLAQELELPTIIHVRDIETPETPTPRNAYWDTLHILKEMIQPNQRFILHCISGPKQYLTTALELGAYVGVAANITYKNAHLLRELVQLVPKDRLLLETDAPFLPPQTFRGKGCEPWMITETEAYLRDIMHIDTNQCFLNAQKLFL